jgi:hypothetical protein
VANKLLFAHYQHLTIYQGEAGVGNTNEVCPYSLLVFCSNAVMLNLLRLSGAQEFQHPPILQFEILKRVQDDP